MLYLEHTCALPTENLALDEVLLDQAERGSQPLEILRIWMPSSPLVVIGRSSQLAAEVELPACQRLGIPALRRTSGGAAIVTGQGCLMYAVVLSYELRPALRALDAAHRLVMQTTLAALSASVPAARHQGTCDLTLDGRKFSGNSLRCRRSHLLYHGTLLCDFDLSLISSLLRTPPRQPDYRSGRGHADFVTNLHVAPEQLAVALRAAWGAKELLTDWPRDEVAALAREKYASAEWNQRQ